MRLVPTRFFRKHELLAVIEQPIRKQRISVLPDHTVEALYAFVARLDETEDGIEVTEAALTEDPALAVFVSVVVGLGAARIERTPTGFSLTSSGPLAKDMPRSLLFFLENGVPLFEDWTRRYKTYADRLCALELLHHMELQRIDLAHKLLEAPTIFHRVPVAFAIIKAKSHVRKQDVYLLELNKDWERYNLIGGKQQPSDGGDFTKTLLREIGEELGESEQNIQLTRLNSSQLDGFSLSGHTGVLTFWPCVMFHARFLSGHIGKRDKDRWFTLEDIVARQGVEDQATMINPVYLNYLLQELPGGLEGLPYSVEPIDKPARRFREFINANWPWLVGALAILGALIELVRRIA